jgi:flagellar M-ring protein FliF
MTEALVLGLLALVAAIGVAVLLRRRPSRPARPAPTPQSPPASTEADRPDSGRIKGRVRASSKRTVGGIVERHPDEAVSMLRRWIKSGGQADDR